ncbi:MAG: DUF1361 domain-containing protein [Clostridium sp.]
MVCSVLWLIFFPNSVYMVTDMIHIHSEELVWHQATAGYS